jgi:hypothetical protein
VETSCETCAEPLENQSWQILLYVPLVAWPLLKDLEKRWKEAENPLFFFTFALHPAYRSTVAKLVLTSKTNNGNWNNDHIWLCVA